MRVADEDNSNLTILSNYTDDEYASYVDEDNSNLTILSNVPFHAQLVPAG